MTGLTETIKTEIRQNGPITFDRFMSLALYGEGGYYRSGTPVSASGDYFTAPVAHPAFGALIAVQLRQMWQLLGQPGTFTTVEMGAGSGSLGADITDFAHALDKKFALALNYRAFDIALRQHSHYPVQIPGDMQIREIGCVLSNELLDAMPVHRFVVQNSRLQEIFVGLDGDNFVEVLGEPSTPEIERRVDPFLEGLPDGYRGEVNAHLDEWTLQIKAILHTGWTMTIDYGFDRAELYRPDRLSGSLRCYYQHTLGQDPLWHAGKQDITSHVDFTALDEAMTSAGFAITGHTTQADFMSRLGMDRMRESLRSMRLPRPELRANEAGMRSLVDPAGMGGFRVAVHGKGVEGLRLRGLPGAGDMSSVENLPATPLLNPSRHINLLGPTQQQQGYFEVQSLEELFGE